MKQLIFDDICLKLDDLRIPYTQDDKYIRVNTAFYDVGVGVEPKKVLYELSVLVDEESRSVSMYVKTSDEFLLASGSGSAQPHSSIFRKVRHISFNGNDQGTVTTIDLGEVPNTVKDSAIRHGWKFRTALNFNKSQKKPQSLRPEQEVVKSPEPIEPEPEMPETAEAAAPAQTVISKTDPPENGFFKRFIKRKKYSPRH